MTTWGDMPFKPHVESFEEWIEEDIEPVDELDSSGVTDEYANKELGPE